MFPFLQCPFEKGCHQSSDPREVNELDLQSTLTWLRTPAGRTGSMPEGRDSLRLFWVTNFDRTFSMIQTYRLQKDRRCHTVTITILYYDCRLTQHRLGLTALRILSHRQLDEARVWACIGGQ